MNKSQNTKKDLRITVEKQVWESTLNRSMVLEAENYKLKELLKECEHMIIAYSINNNTYTKDEVKKTITKIDEVLKCQE